MVRFGPAGWTYKDWEGRVYPKPRPKAFQPLEAMASLFDVVEINTSFYRPISPHHAHVWLERTEANPHFRFTAKLWRRFTHERAAPWTAEEVRWARVGLTVLQEAGRLGAVLVQFPWSFRNTPESRDWVDGLAGAFEGLPLVLEVRHASWNEPSYDAELVERGLGFVNIDQPLFKDSLGPSARATAAVGYVRVHGRNHRDWFRQGAAPIERYDYLYSAGELAPWAERTKALAQHPRVRDVYVITNNHARGQGVVNALMLQAMVTGQQVRAPEGLLREYPGALGPYVRQGPAQEAPGP
ncbi:DUF72 domain-containing protein [Stigmatella erecta]|uniref:Uncharacterized conserved protein YecE, DUF72 family n=1 Tax=Stigmatella erecta TaxID=83460 RepID=A0A1I0L7D7_9BACT|nr:DUF72 domain-containing protein [Stigmatella erecta]SEU35806.1 Uncharacterized conserved protein YecE, DUF72 family [Stigmatella erecta]